MISISRLGQSGLSSPRPSIVWSTGLASQQLKAFTWISMDSLCLLAHTLALRQPSILNTHLLGLSPLPATDQIHRGSHIDQRIVTRFQALNPSRHWIINLAFLLLYCLFMTQGLINSQRPKSHQLPLLRPFRSHVIRHIPLFADLKVQAELGGSRGGQALRQVGPKVICSLGLELFLREILVAGIRDDAVAPIDQVAIGIGELEGVQAVKRVLQETDGKWFGCLDMAESCGVSGEEVGDAVG